MYLFETSERARALFVLWIFPPTRCLSVELCSNFDTPCNIFDRRVPINNAKAVLFIFM